MTIQQARQQADEVTTLDKLSGLVYKIARLKIQAYGYYTFTRNGKTKVFVTK